MIVEYDLLITVQIILGRLSESFRLFPYDINSIVNPLIGRQSSIVFTSISLITSGRQCSNSDHFHWCRPIGELEMWFNQYFASSIAATLE